MNNGVSENHTPPLPSLLSLAFLWRQHGFSCVPVAEDGSKRPDLLTWKTYQERLPTIEELTQWFPPHRTGIGIITGAISGNAEVLDFDQWDVYQSFCERAHLEQLGPLLDRVRAGYEERSPNGVHLLWRCPTIDGNTKLASNGKKATIETRGEGGFCIVAPSHGRVHASGLSYQLLQGGPAHIVTISATEREALLVLCRTFDTSPPRPEQFPSMTSSGARNGDRPGDLYAAATTWREILEPHGWVWLYRYGEVDYWRRPGKQYGASATTNYAGSDLFYCFSSSTPFSQERGYGKFSVYALLNHGSDFQAAAYALASKGYSSSPPLPPLLNSRAQETNPHPTEQGTVAPSLPLTDAGNAERLVARHGTRLRWCAPWKKWLFWDGKQWGVDQIGSAKQLALETIRALYGEAASHSMRAQAADQEKERAQQAALATSLIQHARRSEANSRLDAMVSLTSLFVPVLPDALDKDQWVLNCENGIVDLRTGNITPHDPQKLITRCLSIAYDVTASCPLWEAFLLKVLGGDADLLWFLQKAIGYSLTGDIREQCLFFLYGLGQNGKSTFLQVLSALLGSYGEQTDFSTFAHKEGEGIRNDLARIRGARTVLAVEAGEGKRLDEVLVKRLTGGDIITARFLYAEYFSYLPTFKIWFAANHKPTIYGTEKAIWRRIRLIPFQVTVSEEEKDPELGKKLLDELPGILRWAVFGCQAWQVEGLTPPCSVIEATEGYKTEQDALLDYLEERCLISEVLSVPARVLYEDYVAWCGKTRPIGINGFSLRLKERGFTNERSLTTRKTVWKGVGLRVE